MKFKLAILLTVISVSAAYADVFSFTTPAGSSVNPGGPVNASATVTTGTNSVTIVLNDLLANPTDAAQLISDFDFVLSNGATTGSALTQAGSQINVASNGTVSSQAGNPTGWQINNNVGGGIQISALGGGQPTDLIIGPPPAGGVYTAANGSIAGNAPHNPFISQTGTFTLTVTGVTSTTRVTSAIFSFGTTAGVNIPGTPVSSVPEPTSVLLFGSTLGVLLVSLRKRLSSR